MLSTDFRNPRCFNVTALTRIEDSLRVSNMAFLYENVYLLMFSVARDPFTNMVKIDNQWYEIIYPFPIFNGCTV